MRWVSFIRTTEFPDSAWLPATALEISEDWSMNPAKMKVGDSATRTVTVKAGGLTGPQLPPLQEPELAGIKVYADRPQTENITASDGITALGINSAAWVITEPGDYRIPEISIPWWDTQADQLRYAAIPARTLSVAAAAIPASDARNPPSAGLAPSPGNLSPDDAVSGAPAAQWHLLKKQRHLLKETVSGCGTFLGGVARLPIRLLAPRPWPVFLASTCRWAGARFSGRNGSTVPPAGFAQYC